jgi:hypothetical protein
LSYINQKELDLNGEVVEVQEAVIDAIGDSPNRQVLRLLSHRLNLEVDYKCVDTALEPGDAYCMA